MLKVSDIKGDKKIVIALLGIMVHNADAVEKVNGLLHDFRGSVLGRMGLPLKEQGVNVTSVVLNADSGEINALAGKLGGISGVRAKALYGGV